jgi:hypothetical protein
MTRWQRDEVRKRTVEVFYQNRSAWKKRWVSFPVSLLTVAQRRTGVGRDKGIACSEGFFDTDGIGTGRVACALQHRVSRDSMEVQPGTDHFVITGRLKLLSNSIELLSNRFFELGNELGEAIRLYDSDLARAVEHLSFSKVSILLLAFRPARTSCGPDRPTHMCTSWDVHKTIPHLRVVQ